MTPPPSRINARLTTGSTLRHVVTMTFAGSLGLIAIFLVDFLSLFYISLLKDEKLTAGVGYATSVLFVAISFSIGLMIAVSAVVARRLGAGDREAACKAATTGVVLSAGAGAAVGAGLLALLPFILDAFGAEGVPRAVATRYLWIVLPSNGIMAAGMALSGLLRAIGDARRAMMVTLIGGIATAFLDPLFIFTFKFGTDGAAIVTIIARLIMLWIGLVGVIGHYQLLIRPTLADMRAHVGALAQVAVPAVLTNVASPVAASFVLTVVRQFGHEAVAANTIIDRVVPLAFSVVFALSGSIGPILAQNFGAGLHARVRSALRDSLLFALAYCLIVWAVLAMGRDVIPAIFGASERTAEFIRFYCLIGVAAWIFNALLFVANAAFNNLGFPFYSMLFNWGRASLGTLPFALTGAHLGGYPGLCIGLIVGWGMFGIAAVLTAFRTVARLEKQAAPGVSSGRGAG